MLLLYVYVASLVVGGILLGASLFLGHHDADHDLHAEVGGDAHAEVDGHGGDVDHAGDHGLELSDFWLPFVSVRFWVYFLCFFGLTGTLFTVLALAGKWSALAVALGMGAFTGFSAAFIIQRLKKVEVGTASTEEDFKGMEGIVKLPLSPGGKGKVRLELRGQTVDLVARSEETKLLEIGQKVLVVDFREDEALVVSASDLELHQGKEDHHE
jgi:membrane protein implicated in regulation of membrane protease activity